MCFEWVKVNYCLAGNGSTILEGCCYKKEHDQTKIRDP